MNTINLPVSTTLHLVINFLEKQGLCVDYNDLHNHILSVEKDKKNKKKIKFKPKISINNNINNNNINNNNINNNNINNNNDNDNDKHQKLSKINDKPKKKFKVKTKYNDYEKFVNICNDNKLQYFQFNDEYNWKGPSIKINQDTFDLSIFQSLEIHMLEGYGFAIIRPKKLESDKKIIYNELNYESCKIIDEDTYSLNASDNEIDEEIDEEIEAKINDENIYIDETEEEEEEIFTNEWKFIPKNIIYQLDEKTNNIYCNQTDMYVGKKINDFTIDFDTKENEKISIDYDN